jgi:hypothetical protein
MPSEYTGRVSTEMKAQPVNSRAVGKEKVRPGGCSTTLAPQRVTYATYFGPFSAGFISAVHRPLLLYVGRMVRRPVLFLV